MLVRYGDVLVCMAAGMLCNRVVTFSIISRVQYGVGHSSLVVWNHQTVYISRGIGALIQDNRMKSPYYLLLTVCKIVIEPAFRNFGRFSGPRES